MYDETRIKAALQALPLLRVDRYVTRFIFEAHRGTALEVTGALGTGGRYNPIGMPALYTALRHRTALFESTQFFEDEDPIMPMAMLSVRVNSEKIADLTHAATMRALGTNRSELTAAIVDKQIGTAPTQTLGCWFGVACAAARKIWSCFRIG